MKVSLEQLLGNQFLLDLEAEVQNELLKLKEQLPSDIEFQLAQIPVQRLRVGRTGFESDEEYTFFANNLNKTDVSTNSHAAFRELWGRPFSLLTIRGDLEDLNSFLVGKKMRIRTEEVAATNKETGQIGHTYPSASTLSSGLSTLAEISNAELGRQNPVMMASIVWVYLMRLHPFTDGNGRTSRAFMNIALRNFKFSDRPILYLGPLVYANLDQLKLATFGSEFANLEMETILRLLLLYTQATQSVLSDN